MFFAAPIEYVDPIGTSLAGNGRHS
jgi:hypothetical protein